MRTCGDGSERQQVLVLAQTIARKIERGVAAVLREVERPPGSRSGDGYPLDDEEL